MNALWYWAIAVSTLLSVSVTRHTNAPSARRRKHGGPRQPYLPLEHQLISGPSGQPDRRHRQAERDGGPEQPLASAPRLPPGEDDRRPRHRRNQQRDRPEPAPRRRLAAHQPSDDRVAD